MERICRNRWLVEWLDCQIGADTCFVHSPLRPSFLPCIERFDLPLRSEDTKQKSCTQGSQPRATFIYKLHHSKNKASLVDLRHCEFEDEVVQRQGSLYNSRQSSITLLLRNVIFSDLGFRDLLVFVNLSEKMLEGNNSPFMKSEKG